MGAQLTRLALGGVCDRRGAGAGEDPKASESLQRPLRLSAQYLGRAQNCGPEAARQTPWRSGGSPPALLRRLAAPNVCDCGIPLLALRTGLLERGHGHKRLGRSCCCTVASLRRMQEGPTQHPLLQ
ncbi:hypothetical protein NDU88_003774 [Pleurodeles waltl]|uniref:Uncharacterized protein n=1 Tax=Pleurodeles waltl TaxID=8319 RepID=A0AAV7PDM1_PLEWA|nr:hypothetical protein NDU88_003774 [Pleurodeles waltl]